MADLGEELAAEGIARASEAQERVKPLSLEQALDIIFCLALTRDFFDADDVHEYLLAHGLPDLENPGAWGGLWRRAKGKWIEPVTDSEQWRKSSRPSQHAKPLPLYRSLVVGDC
ncbi:MAG: hypothetical protein HY834_14790 [Devosia nanyangense]|uniref:Uncharacterized protein n=1 Tax=Devosia nanyangense TaxID=1228055 RepID=A0A933L2G0_9HYPH|nr:hypothetical protein [Devosia nanyangense]